MNKNYKLYLKCILQNNNFSFITNQLTNNNSYQLILQNNVLYYLCLHLRFSSLFYSTQLVDIFSYEVLLSSSNKDVKKSNSSIVVYNFHLLNSNLKFFFFVKVPSKVHGIKSLSFNKSNYSSVLSITELFFAANWLEREVSELNGVFFTGKKDIRNLMLQYGDSSTPFQKSFPTIGLKEMYFNPLKDTIIQNPISIQI